MREGREEEGGHGRSRKLRGEGREIRKIRERWGEGMMKEGDGKG